MGTSSNHKCNIVLVTTSMVGRGQGLSTNRINAHTKKQWLARITKPFTLQEGVMYLMGQDNIF
jgi:hypothetical protein